MKSVKNGSQIQPRESHWERPEGPSAPALLQEDASKGDPCFFETAPHSWLPKPQREESSCSGSCAGEEGTVRQPSSEGHDVPAGLRQSPSAPPALERRNALLRRGGSAGAAKVETGHFCVNA